MGETWGQEGGVGKEGGAPNVSKGWPESCGERDAGSPELLSSASHWERHWYHTVAPDSGALRLYILPSVSPGVPVSPRGQGRAVLPRAGGLQGSHSCELVDKG